LENTSPESAAAVASAITMAASIVSPESTPEVAAAVIQAAEEIVPAEVLSATIDATVVMAMSINPAAAADIAASVGEILAVTQNPDLLVGLAQTLALLSPELAPDIVSKIAAAAIENLSPQEAVALLSTLAKTIGDIVPDQFAGVVAALLSVVANFPPSFQSEATTAIEGVRPSIVQSEPLAEGQVPNESSDLAAENAAANLQGAPAQTDFQAQPVEIRETQKTIPENILKLIAETVSKIEIGETQTTITLQKTPDLPGDVTLEIRLVNGKLEVQITATDPESAALLQNNIAALQGALASASGAAAVSVSVNSPTSHDDLGDHEANTSEVGSDPSDLRGDKSKVQGTGSGKGA
jgi:hypothetical protein